MNAINETLYDVTASTIGDLAMMFLLPVEGDTPPPAWDQSAAVTFEGPFSGTLVVRASTGLLPQLAGNMLGLDVDAESSAAQQEDALKELANVVCGNLLPAIAGPQPVFHIGAPALVETGREEPGTRMGFACLLVDAGALEVALYVNQPSAMERVA